MFHLNITRSHAFLKPAPEMNISQQEGGRTTIISLSFQGLWQHGENSTSSHQHKYFMNAFCEPSHQSELLSGAIVCSTVAGGHLSPQIIL